MCVKMKKLTHNVPSDDRKNLPQIKNILEIGTNIGMILA